MKKFLAILMALCLCLQFGCFGFADNTGAYVLMNIPYSKFYEAEGVVVADHDAVSSATQMKTRVAEQAGGSYHVDSEGTDISGVIFPVYVEDTGVLASLGGVEMTDDSSVSITVSLKGEETTTVYSGKDALFEAPDYSWYVLDAEPAQYKTLTVDGEPSFSAVNTEAEVLDADAAFYFDKHVDLGIRVSGIKDQLDAAAVSAVILTADDGTKVAMRHLENIHKKYDIGFNLDSLEYEVLKGKTITSIQYLTPDSNYLIETNLAVVDDPVLVLLNGTYIELFPEFASEKYYDFWMETIQSYGIDDATAQIYYSMLTDRFMGRLTGEEAIEAYSSDPESMIFDCYFENGLAKLTVNGNVISGVDADGKELFRHVYTYAGEQPVTYFGMDIGTPLHIYQTEDADAGIFTYFAFTDDNLHDTQHIEYRYGDNLEALGSYTDGPYAYWLASGIADGYKDSLIQDCISLFVGENVGGGEEEEAEETENTFGVFPAVAGEAGTTYINLFDVILADTYDVLWQDYVAAVVGAENAADTVARLKGSISSDLYGEQAVEAFADGGMAFDCFFINGAESFTFRDNTVTIAKTDGTSETHTYEYLGEFVIGEGETMNYMGQEFPIGMECDAYQSTDEAGEFQYILLCPDTMDTTFHIEFRYGKDLDELKGYMVGPYAYWLSAGIDRDADEQTIQNVIALFCLENMDFSSHTDAALKQLVDLGFVGTWVADLSAYGDMFAGVNLSFVLDENGHGVTTMNGETTADFEAYALDNGEAGDGAGIYVAYSNLEFEAEAADYTLLPGEDGSQILTFYSDEGVISYVKAAA